MITFLIAIAAFALGALAENKAGAKLKAADEALKADVSAIKARVESIFGGTQSQTTQANVAPVAPVTPQA